MLVIDARLGPTDLDRDMMAYLESGKIPFTIIANKIDKLSRNEALNLVRVLRTEHPNATILPHSSVTHEGKGEIWHTITTSIAQ
jgi:GTP-binding protein EngB required for normal cell division